MKRLEMFAVIDDRLSELDILRDREAPFVLFITQPLC